MPRRCQSTCLPSLFFNLQSNALKLCPQEVTVLPEGPLAEYLGDSTYVLTSNRVDYQLYNYTVGRAIEGERIPGCKSCLLRPVCGGRIETPDGSLVLNPDPRRCHHDTGLHITKNQNAILTTIFNLVSEIQWEELSQEIPRELRATVHEDILSYRRGQWTKET